MEARRLRALRPTGDDFAVGLREDMFADSDCEIQTHTNEVEKGDIGQGGAYEAMAGN